MTPKLYKAGEVCELLQVQPYVLRSWEAEFPDLGVSKTEGGPRIYRRADLEFVLRIKHLLFVEGLTLAGARKKLVGERPPTAAAAAADSAGLDDLSTLLGRDARERILQVKRGLSEIATILAKDPRQGSTVADNLFELAPKASKRSVAKIARPVAATKKKK